ncbi:MAG: hypothetical protein DRJ01_09170 [Bacteroidetes bacterium]|nr:MAG: hypothetical protein DRJ01_09170 [Bacteroidota bacterium]
MNYKKIYIILLIVGIVSISIISYFIFSIDTNQENLVVIDNYLFFNKLFVYCNLFIFVILLVLSNIIYFKNSSKDFFIITVVLFIIFGLLNSFIFSNYIINNFSGYGLSKKSFDILKLIGVFSCLATVIVTVINFTTIRNLKRKKK